MQEAAREHWRNLFRDDETSETPDMESEDFGFWLADWDMALEMGWIFDTKRILPRAGGWLDQTVQDRADIMTYLRGKGWAQAEAKGGSGKTPDLSKRPANIAPLEW